MKIILAMHTLALISSPPLILIYDTALYIQNREVVDTRNCGGRTNNIYFIAVTVFRVLMGVRTRINEAKSCYFQDSRTALWLVGSSRLGPSVETNREVIVSDVTGEGDVLCGSDITVHTHLSQTLCNQGYFSGLVHTTS